MNPSLNKSLTLLELIIAVALLSIVVLGLASIDIFSRHHLIDSDRRAKLQNELAYTLEHMSKNITQGTGNVTQPPLALIANGFTVRVDVNSTPADLTDDTSIYYTLSGNTLSCSISGVTETLSTSILSGVANGQIPSPLPANPSGFYINLSDADSVVEIGLVARYNPSMAQSVDNPQVVMKTRVYARSASTR